MTATAEVQNKSAKVLMIDDHDMIRIGLRAIAGDIVVDGRPLQWLEAANLADGLDILAREADSVVMVLLDLNLADSKGLNGLRQMQAHHPKARVVIMSGTHDAFVIGQARAMGAIGYMPKCGSPQACWQRLNLMLQVALGRAPSSEVCWRLDDHSKASGYDRVAELGPRHLEILELVLSGCTNQEISRAANLSLGTVKNYVSTILLALDVKSRSHLISLFR